MNESIRPHTQDSHSDGKQEELLTRAAIYIRVNYSQSDQVVANMAQEEACRKLAENLGFDVTAVYQDIEPYRAKNNRLIYPSGTDVNRPGLNALLQDAVTGKFGTIIATREDRLYRGLKSMLYVLDIVEKHRINILLTKEVFDPKLMPIKVWLAEMELGKMRERAKLAAKARYNSSRMNNGKE